ncbi:MULTISPECIES: hypothetical protein [unclassified Pseudonocardia]|uniref:SCO6745 family protein n=1 Tax=unclassified Pseudonocardia TaxID=2619320 RepID=UPI002016806D|nr:MULTISPECIES: hypothetical protein [unclassified Pseudonocardia]
MTPPPGPVPAARALWERLEPVHDVVYFTPEARAAAEAAGYRGFWRGYFAMRAAPLGPVGPAPVTAAFHNFHPSMPARALPEVWSLAPPAAALDARSSGAAAALRRIGTGPVDRAAELAWAAASEVDVEGRVLAAANAALPRPGGAVETLWQATTTLREHRGDGHVAVLVARGVGPVAAHLLKAAAGETDAEWLRTARGWSDDDWATGTEDVRRRGWTGPDGTLTSAGAAEHTEIERLTDAAAARPWTALGGDRTDELAALLDPLASAVLAAGDVPERSPVGLVRSTGES